MIQQHFRKVGDRVAEPPSPCIFSDEKASHPSMICVAVYTAVVERPRQRDDF